MRYMHRPTLVDAHRVNRERCPGWVTKAIARGWIKCSFDGGLYVNTPRGIYCYASDGDYIVEHSETSFSIVPAKEFESLYEPLKKGD